MGKNVIITGATGMIGSLVLQHCLESPEISGVTSLVRRPTDMKHAKLNEVLVDDFAQLDKDAGYFESVDIVYYCLGVYTGAVDRDQFRVITVEYPEALAKNVYANNPDVRFCLLSGAGADRLERSRLIFAKDKGIIENRLAKMGLGSFHAFRPGYIYPVTPRSEPNFSYRVMRMLYPLIKLFGRNTSITSTELAASIFDIGLHGSDKEILENKDMRI